MIMQYKIKDGNLKKEEIVPTFYPFIFLTFLPNT